MTAVDAVTRDGSIAAPPTAPASRYKGSQLAGRAKTSRAQKNGLKKLTAMLRFEGECSSPLESFRFPFVTILGDGGEILEALRSTLGDPAPVSSSTPPKENAESCGFAEGRGYERTRRR
jgi:hypothetical protein